MNINIPEIKIFLKKIKVFKYLKSIARHFFASSLVIFVLLLITGGILFCKYAFLVQNVKPEVPKKNSLLKEDVYKKVSDVWQKEKTKFDEAGTKEYLDPFRKIIQIPNKEGSQKLTE